MRHPVNSSQLLGAYSAFSHLHLCDEIDSGGLHKDLDLVDVRVRAVDWLRGQGVPRGALVLDGEGKGSLAA